MSLPGSVGYSNPTINDVVIPLEDMKVPFQVDTSDTDKKIQKVKEKQIDDCSIGLILAGGLSGLAGGVSVVVGVPLWVAGSIAGPIVTGIGLGLIGVSLPFCGSACYYNSQKSKKNVIKG